jgi:hypothetical protein
MTPGYASDQARGYFIHTYKNENLRRQLDRKKKEKKKKKRGKKIVLSLTGTMAPQ